MKRVRFQVNGETLAGRFEDGRLVAEDGRDFGAEDVTWLPPLVPGTIYGLALNYHDHAEELARATGRRSARRRLYALRG